MNSGMLWDYLNIIARHLLLCVKQRRGEQLLHLLPKIVMLSIICITSESILRETDAIRQYENRRISEKKLYAFLEKGKPPG